METDRIRLKLHLAVFMALIVLGIVGFMLIEKLSLVDAIYFSIVTMATVGYGDIHPQSAIGKLLAIVLIIGGVGTFLGIVASITDLFVKRREELLRLEKLNMVTGLFFSEMGNGLLKQFVQLDPENGALQAGRIANDWEDKDFEKAISDLNSHMFVIDSRRGSLSEMRSYLQSQSGLLLRLLENPIVHEHGVFSDLLRAIFHLRDELMNRSELTGLPDSDIKHLEGDMVRIYRLLVLEWVRYMQYLKINYGYLFSLAMRLNPFNLKATAVVKG